jgi:isopenicillin-N epimerase
MLCERLRVEPPCPEAMLGSMATLPLPERLQTSAPAVRFEPLQTWLFEHDKIEVPLICWGTPARRWFRISAHGHNCMEDYERLALALEKI